MIDYVLIRHGMAHPDIWLMWAAIFDTALNSIVLAIGLTYVLITRRKP